MLKAIATFFNDFLLIDEQPQSQDSERALRLATGALLIEMARADYDVKDIELDHILQILQSHFSLSDVETSQLLELANNRADDSTTYHNFTSLINQHYSPEQKVQLIEMLWQVAYADRHIEKYEDYLVRKIADLLYVPHRDFIAAKHRVIKQAKRESES
ncbi:MAG: TerB family tellurite resistance protein [Chromatiales bacterium]|jgi:uncharacterized tellurite resistance protein B-like protein